VKDLADQSFLFAGRLLVWFSCGAASAVAAKLAVEQYADQYPIEVCYCDTLAHEHPDNRRFLKDVSDWIGQEIKILKSHRYDTIYDVFRGERYLNGPNGAPCTRALKRVPRERYQDPWDYHVFGYTMEEAKRINDFESDNPSLQTIWILRDNKIGKSECYRRLRQAGIELPTMYKLGYKNNNCIGCVKGGAGYWNKIRRDFPEYFWRMAALERELGFCLLRIKGEPVYLDELDPEAGHFDEEPDIECGPQCVSRV